MAQAIPTAASPAATANPADQPLAGQNLGTNLTLNQGVNTIIAENESFDRFGLGLTALGGAETNFLGSETNKQTAGFMQYTAAAGLILRTVRTRYFALYQPQYNWYPQFSQVNNFAQSFYLGVTHSITERTGIEWDTTAARYLSLDQFLPEALGIGGIGVVVPTLGTQLLENSFEQTNAATTLNLRHLMGPRIMFTGTLTSALFLMVPADVTGASSNFTEKVVTSGADLRLDYQWTTNNAVGIEATPIYIYGLQPGGHETAEALEGTYQRQLTPTWSARVGAGPLFLQTSSPLFGSAQNTSYALTAALTRQVRQSQFSANYSRALLVDLLEPPYVVNSVSSSAYLPMTSHWIFTGAASYTRDAGSALTSGTLGAAFGPGDFYGGSAQIAYQATSKMQLFALYSLLSEHYSPGSGPSTIGFTQNSFSAGIQFNIGNPVVRTSTSGGMQ